MCMYVHVCVCEREYLCLCLAYGLVRAFFEVHTFLGAPSAFQSKHSPAAQSRCCDGGSFEY